MELLGDTGHVESRFGPLGDGVSVGARQVHGLRGMYHTLRNHFGRARWNSYVTWVMPNLISIHLEIVLILTQIVACLRRTYPRLGNHFGRAQWNSYVTWVMSNLVSIRLETVLVSVQDRCTVCAKHTMAQKIILYATDGTPRRRGSSGSSFRSVWR